MQSRQFEEIVGSFYEPLYRFALALAGQPADASDLTQETFYAWATKGGQLRDITKVKSWLFTTLYRRHLNSRRRQTRFPHRELEDPDVEIPSVAPAAIRQMEASDVLQALRQLDERYRAPLTLFYLEEHSYVEIAGILDVPIGTVMSRLARGKALLRSLLADRTASPARNILPIDAVNLDRKKRA